MLNKIAAALIVEPLGVLLEKHLTDSVDASERALKVMRNGIAEGLQLLIRRLHRSLTRA